MLKTLTPAIIAAVVLVGAHAAQAQVAGLKSLDAVAGPSVHVQKTGRRGRRRARVAAGVIALGVLGAAAAVAAHDSADYRRERRWRRHQRLCNRWRRSCYRGNDRSCWRYDSRC